MEFKKKDILEIIIAFVVAWMFYQSLAAVTGTGMPIVSVVSDSMLHSDSFDSWWQSKGQYYSSKGVQRETFTSFAAPGGLECGDILFVVGDPDPDIGDIVIYSKPGFGYTIVHRIVEKTAGGYVTKGDNNDVQDAPILSQQVQGRMAFVMPLLGAPRLMLYYIESIVSGVPLNLGGTCSLLKV